MSNRKPPQVREPQPEGTNTRLIKNALVGIRQPRIDTRNAKIVERRIEEYLEYCAENDISPSIAGCANWLGVNKDTLRAWYTGKYGTPEHQKVATMFYGVMQEIWARDMHEGNINPVSGIFIGKAFYGYKDTQEIVIHNSDAQSQLSIDDLIAESKLLPGGDNAPAGVIDAEATEIESGAERAQNDAERRRTGAERAQNGP